MSKFAALAAKVDEPFKVFIIDPVTDEAIVDKVGNKAFIEVLAADSVEGQQFDREQARKRNTRLMNGRKEAMINEDQEEVNRQKSARLTRSWHLVDPNTGEAMDVPCTVANALELYSEQGMRYLWIQVWLGLNEPANFIKRSSKTSSSSPSTASATPAA